MTKIGINLTRECIFKKGSNLQGEALRAKVLTRESVFIRSTFFSFPEKRKKKVDVMNMLRRGGTLPLLCKKLIFLKNEQKYPAGEAHFH